MSMTNWRKRLESALSSNDETFADITGNTMSDAQMDTEFDSGYGGEEGCAFTVWTVHNVYFPACYDGSEWVASVPRNPNGKATGHIGGG